MRKHIIAVLTIVVCSLTLASISSAQDLKPPYDNPKEKNEKLSNLRFWEKQLKEYKNNKPKTQRELLQDKIDSKKAEAEKAKNNMLSEEDFATVNALEAEIKNLKDSLALLPPEPKEDKTLDKIQDERDFLVLDIYLLDVLDHKCPDDFDDIVKEAETKLKTIKTPDIKSVATSFLPMLKNYERYTADLYNFMTSEKNKAMNIIFGADEKMPNNIDQGFMSTLRKTEYYKYYQNFKQDKYAPSIAYLNAVVDRIIEMKDSRLKGATARVAKMEKDFIIEDLTIDSKEHMEELVANYFAPKHQTTQPQNLDSGTFENLFGQIDGKNNNVDNNDTPHPTQSANDFTAEQPKTKEQWLDYWEKQKNPNKPNELNGVLSWEYRSAIEEEMNRRWNDSWNTMEEFRIISEISSIKSDLDQGTHNNPGHSVAPNQQPTSQNPRNNGKNSKEDKDNKKIEQPNPALIISNYEKAIKAVNINADYEVFTNELKSLINQAENDQRIQMSPDKPKILCNAGDRWVEGMITYHKNNQGHISQERMKQIKNDADYFKNKSYINKRKNQFNQFYMDYLLQ